MRAFILLTCVLHAAYAAPQFVSFKDGKVGVNFGGYHAEAGLGGILTGNAADGGLSASAGTPWGQNAAAGLNGRVDGRTAGVAYAGAQASPSVGASAIIGGDVNEGGFKGAEAHANGKMHSTLHTANAVHENPHASAEVTNTIQKIKPPKKYHLIADDQHSVTNSHAVEHDTNVGEHDNTNGAATTTAESNLSASDATTNGPTTFIAVKRHHHRIHQHRLRKQQRKQLLLVQPHPVQEELPTTQQHTPEPVPSIKHVKTVHHQVNVQPNTNADVGVRVNSDVVHSALNIPIGILQSLQKSLSGFGFEKSVHVHTN